MCSYCCSWSVSCSVWPDSGVWTGCLFALPQKARPSAPRCTVFSSPVPQMIAPPVASPAPTRQVEGQQLRVSRPWSEVKSRRGAPKRVDTEGFACPNPQCQYLSNTDALFHAALRGWQASACRGDPGLSLSSLPYHVHFPAQHPFVPVET